MLPRPTDAELEILGVLWSSGPSTVRHVHGVLSAGKGTGYTTVLKLMQIMAEKGLLLRDESRRSHIYRPAIAPDRTRRQLVSDLVRRAFDGSARKLVLQALGDGGVTAAELAEIRQLIDRLERDP
jgi:predicted transcriptional regulator